ncbi:MAG: ribonuclease Y [Kiritimatiellae bacterium]|nr:ribonuclease Y [Kiritimatiellia bacterium]MDD3545138.1 ribonuclease Y [Kiritimatiellia bacterium]MDD4025412.1 ribonuclease Y [Kiritimatiellia bacterium]MDD4622309.1 ribonuclease Y [Kiritimatiellia bacterium]
MTNFTWYDVSDATVGLLFGLAGILGGYALRGLIGRWQADAIEKQAQYKLTEADNEVKNRLKEADIIARAEVVKAREEFEKSTKTRRKELQDIEERLTVREENMDKKAILLEKKDQAVAKKQDDVQRNSDDLRQKLADVDKKCSEATQFLQRLAGMTHEEAKRELQQRAEQEIRREAGSLIRRIQEEAKETADREAANIVAAAVQRFALSHASEMMTCTVPLPSDDIKGRIIGREGRNIRTLEAVTGVNMLIDDTPEAVVISGFDPVRREIARQALEQLVADGRIHPARIEEVVESVQANMEKTIIEAGESAAYEAHVLSVPSEVLKCVGRLKFRTSYAQNVLRHSVEVSHLMGMMAPELGLDPAVARRVGFFHDIGKAMDQESQGLHALLGADFLKQHGEDAVVVNGVAAHHGDVPSEGLYGVLCSAADAISSSRPGARAETLGVYVQRLERLEAIANGFPGVKKTFAVQAGREVRVIVDPGQVNDNDAMVMAREISQQIGANMQFPGQIKVVVVRETRCIEYAK